MYGQLDPGSGTVAEYDDNTYAEYDTGYTDQDYDTSLLDQEAGMSGTNTPLYTSQIIMFDEILLVCE